MSQWAWINGVTKAVTGGFSSLYLYGGLLAAGAALSGGAWLWHGWKVDGAHDAAFAAGRLEVENDVIREQQRELTRMVGITNNLNEAYREQVKTIDDAERLARADAERVLELKNERDAALAKATPEAVRGYATAAGDVYEACRVEYRALGFDAERCSSAAHTLNDWAKALTREDIDATRATLRKNPE
jgi:hypothetical protein